jgi:hypothetical protein
MKALDFRPLDARLGNKLTEHIELRCARCDDQVRAASLADCRPQILSGSFSGNPPHFSAIGGDDRMHGIWLV